MDSVAICDDIRMNHDPKKRMAKISIYCNNEPGLLQGRHSLNERTYQYQFAAVILPKY